MGRTTSSGIIGGSTSVNSLNTTVTTGEAVQSGDLLVQHENGKAYYAMDPSVAVNANRPPFPVASALRYARSITGDSSGTVVLDSTISSFDCVELSNGSFVAVWIRSSPQFAIRFQLFDSFGERIGNSYTVYTATNVSPTNSTNIVEVAALTGGGFAIASTKGVSVGGVLTFPAFWVFANDGTLVKDSTDIIPTGTGMTSFTDTPFLSMVALNTGGFAIGTMYQASSQSNPSSSLTVVVCNAVGAIVSRPESHQAATMCLNVVTGTQLAPDIMLRTNPNVPGFCTFWGGIMFRAFDDAGTPLCARTLLYGNGSLTLRGSDMCIQNNGDILVTGLQSTASSAPYNTTLTSPYLYRVYRSSYLPDASPIILGLNQPYIGSGIYDIPWPKRYRITRLVNGNIVVVIPVAPLAATSDNTPYSNAAVPTVHLLDSTLKLIKSHPYSIIPVNIANSYTNAPTNAQTSGAAGDFAVIPDQSGGFTLVTWGLISATYSIDARGNIRSNFASGSAGSTSSAAPLLVAGASYATYTRATDGTIVQKFVPLGASKGGYCTYGVFIRITPAKYVALDLMATYAQHTQFVGVSVATAAANTAIPAQIQGTCATRVPYPKALITTSVGRAITLVGNQMSMTPLTTSPAVQRSIS